VNVMTIDVEDWYHPLIEDDTQWASCEDRVVDSTRRVLDLLDQAGVCATFFVLGYVADRHPDLVREIARRGHEVGSHGYHHRFAYRQTPAEFEADVTRSLITLRAIVDQPVNCYRAPYFSITDRSRWALDVLARLGVRVDSSIFPVHNHRYGIPSAPRHPHEHPNGILEVPPTTLRLAGVNVPVGGGAYFRILPFALLRRAYQRVNREGLPIVFYLHPWEVDPHHPRVRLPLALRWRHYHGLKETELRMRELLRQFPFRPIRDVMAS
jgi:polysaccharide deacetylase family protein (PEP-CTERM system associated)